MKQIISAVILGLMLLPITLVTAPVQAQEGRPAIVVLDPPVNFHSRAGKLGYTAGDTFELKELSMRAVKVLAPEGYSVEGAISELEKHFPDLLVDNTEI